MVEFGANWAEKFRIYEFSDWSNENDFEDAYEWGKYLYYNIVSRVGSKQFSLYFSDAPTIMLSWFNNDMRDRIKFTFLEREEIEDGMSATRVRLAAKNGDVNFIRKSCPAPVAKFLEDNIALLNSES